MSHALRPEFAHHQDASFVARHIGPRGSETDQMCTALGVKSLDHLIDEIVPDTIRLKKTMDLPPSRGERQMLKYLADMAEQNQVFTTMIGMGYYGTVMPPVILRRVFENPGWYTAYTPYQAEASQGRLEALLNFQQMVMDMTGFDLANASLLDEATAAAEAIAMALRVTGSNAKTVFVDADTHPQTIAVIETRLKALGLGLETGDPLKINQAMNYCAVLVSYPASSGEVRDFKILANKIHDAKGLLIAVTDLLALTLLQPPAAWGADIAIGSAQRFGVPMGYGGPHAAFFACKDCYKRHMPGRIIGVSSDADGRMALRMALQTREQHIRRDKATSNICTAQALLAIIAGFYAIYHGPEGLKMIGTRVHDLTNMLASGLKRLEVDVITKVFFDTITVHVPGQAAQICAAARAKKINLRYVDADTIGLSVDETTNTQNVEDVWRCFARHRPLGVQAVRAEMGEIISGPFKRQSSYLTHEVFSRYHSETELLRYMRRLQSKDIALDRSMIPLGSCTMKLNAASEMIPLSWRAFAHMHPFAPLDQAQGYRQLFDELEQMLGEITGFPAVSLQPNAGSQGEYAGLLAIRRYHDQHRDEGRTICLIPTSAHGTNPASAVMAGFEVVGVACDEQGNVDVADLKAKAEQYSARLGALMVTYPSTHGVFEPTIADICDIIHAHGGQVYVDGANLNALVGLSRIADFGGDVCHMNLHKTFCIPHGGGGPGVGPIGVAAHLAPFVPGHDVVPSVNPYAHTERNKGAVSAAPWGSALILPISWAYIAMMGAQGLAQASKIAILNANYIAHRLKDHFPIVYTGARGWVAHECIIDVRALTDKSGIHVEDVAKRLIDYGYHAPTMAWPVPGTLMIEPTESESLSELDRFCDCLIAIKLEIDEVIEGCVSAEQSVVKNAPHAAEQLAGKWTRSYSVAKAFFPLPFVAQDKFWPPVARIDNVAGDRNLSCGCPPVEAYLGSMRESISEAAE